MKVHPASWKRLPFFLTINQSQPTITWVLGLRRRARVAFRQYSGFPSFGHSDFSLFLALALAFLDITNKFSDASLRLKTL